MKNAHYNQHKIIKKLVWIRNVNGVGQVISLSLGNQITTTLATSVLPVSSEKFDRLTTTISNLAPLPGMVADAVVLLLRSGAC